MGEKERCKQGLVGRSEGKNPLRMPMLRWRDNIKMNLTEVGWGMDWIDLTHDRDRLRGLVNTAMNLQVP